MSSLDVLRPEHIRQNWRSYGIVAALAVVFVPYFLNYLHSVPAEDAVMLFDYARNLSRHGIITYGQGTSVPIEGATDFLYMVLIALISKLGFSEFAAALILNFLGVLIILALFRNQSRSVSVLLIAILATCFSPCSEAPTIAAMLGHGATCAVRWEIT